MLIRPSKWMPIFKEAPPDVLSRREFHISIRAEPSIPKAFSITSAIHSPGLVRSQKWELVDEDKWIHLLNVSEANELEDTTAGHSPTKSGGVR
jgi:hypothetical protein